jgi:transposase
MSPTGRADPEGDRRPAAGYPGRIRGRVRHLLAGGAAGNYGFTPHLAHSLRCKAIASARLKNDKVDAATLAQLLRADLLPEAWIAPPPVRQLRALLRHRVALVRLRTLLRNRIHAIVADYGHDLPGRQKLTAWAPADMLPDGKFRRSH